MLTELEKRTLRTLANTLHEMSDFEKGYMLGVAENEARRKIEGVRKDEPVLMTSEARQEGA